ncbi:hypothetical protein CLIB1423_04S02322 [[Candida] railenensis]|uniref:Uncharacterized protein n=1 Tax=[Candida] railenensis TaxID=45579 RepID=A0A9P0QMU2_9ASCO|nr:hypothetical protein CLIB1423_04S02322 [[Candida] railenensis]
MNYRNSRINILIQSHYQGPPPSGGYSQGYHQSAHQGAHQGANQDPQSGNYYQQGQNPQYYQQPTHIIMVPPKETKTSRCIECLTWCSF